MTSRRSAPFLQNRLLAALPAEAVGRLAPHLRPVALAFRDIILRPGDTMPDVYFPLSGMVSLIALTDDGTALETGLVGREGMVPLVGFLGVGHSSQELLVQAGGEALRIPVTVLREQAQGTGPLHDLLERYTAAALLQATQATVCNGLHPVGARLARWLLLAQDRAESATLPMSQRFLGLMLGVRRASVTTTAAALQQVGLIRSHYGRVEVVDRAGLEAAACGCYAAMRNATERVFTGIE
jgi:CRP-like cAMP-binding protein